MSGRRKKQLHRKFISECAKIDLLEPPRGLFRRYKKVWQRHRFDK